MLYVCFQTHWDREWYQSAAAYQVRLLEMMAELKASLEQKTLSKFSLDGQTILLEDYLALCPQESDWLMEAFQSGQLHTGPWYVMPDTILSGLETSVRNLQKGTQQAEHYGCKDFTGYLPDSFGHSDALPALFQQLGIDTAMVWRGRTLSKSQSAVFKWKSPDGSDVLAYQLPEGYLQNVLQDPWLNLEERKKGLRNLIEELKTAHTTFPSLLMLGGDHLGPPRKEALELLHSLEPKLQVVHTHAWMEALKTESKSNQNLPSESGALRAYGPDTPFLLAGTLSARLALKLRDVELEQRLTQELEPLSALLGANHLKLPANFEALLDKAWTQFLKNQPHDSLCGCSLDEVHRLNHSRYDQVEATIQALLERMESSLMSAYQSEQLLIQSSPSPSLNPTLIEVDLRWPLDSDLPETLPIQWLEQDEGLKSHYLADCRDLPLSHLMEHQWRGLALLKDESLEKLTGPFAKVIDLKSSARTLSSLPETQKSRVLFSEAQQPEGLENAVLKVSIAPSGAVEVLDKAANQSYGPLGFFKLLEDRGDSYNRVPVPEAPIQDYQLKTIEVVAEGPLVASLKLLLVGSRPEVKTPSLEVTLSLEMDSLEILWSLQWVQTEPYQLLQVGFKQASIPTQIHLKQHLGWTSEAIQPPSHQQRFEGISVPEKTLDEWVPNNAYHTGLLATEKTGSLRIPGLREIEWVESDLYITLHRGFGHISGGVLPTRGFPAGPPFETPDGQGLGPQTRQFSWLAPKVDYKKLSNNSSKAKVLIRPYEKMLAKSETQAPKLSAPITLNYLKLPEGVDLVACLATKDEDGKSWLVYRLLNPSEQPLSLNIQQAGEVWNLRHNKLETLNSNTELKLAPHQLITLAFRF